MEIGLLSTESRSRHSHSFSCLLFLKIEERMDHHDPPIVRWGLVLPLAAAAVAFYFGLDDHVQSVVSSLSSSSSSKGETFCYQGVKTPSWAEIPSANCFTVRDGKFFEVAPASEGVEVQSGFAYPGLWDGHGHLLQYGEFLHSVDLFGSESFDDVRRRLLGYLDGNPGVGGAEEWVRGVGWDQMALGGMPTAVCPASFFFARRWVEECGIRGSGYGGRLG